MPSSSVVHLKLNCLLKKQTHDNIIGAKKLDIQPPFERYKRELGVAFLKLISIYYKFIFQDGTYLMKYNVNSQIYVDYLLLLLSFLFYLSGRHPF